MKGLELLFNPRSIALIGAAHTEIKLGGIVLKNLLKFRGRVYPVNPKYNELMGLKAYPAVQAIPEPVDLAILMRPAAEMPLILQEFKGRARYAVVVSSGFAETGATELQDRLKDLGRESGIRILGPNCMGIFNPRKYLDTFFISRERLTRPRRGNTAVLSQSGAVMSCLFGAMRSGNIGVSSAVSYGNAVDIDESDLFEHLALDPDTKVVISYIESVADGRRFVEKAGMVSERKPLIILKSGKGRSGQTAAFSHTGRLAGRYEVFHSILRQFGINEVHDFDELMDATKALSYQARSRGRRVLIVTNGGGSGVLAADACLQQGLEVVALPVDKRAILGRLFPGFFGVNNPFDLTAQVRDEDYVAVLTRLKDDYDGFLVIALPGVVGITEGLGGLLGGFVGQTAKPLVVNMPPGKVSQRIASRLEKVRIPVYPTPEGAVKGLRALLIREEEAAQI